MFITFVNKQQINGTNLYDFTANLYDFTARMYDPLTGRFGTQDPHQDKYTETSSYLYCLGNPINIIDSTGCDGKLVGTGSKEDPYTITANYYYDSETMDKNLISIFEKVINFLNKKTYKEKSGKETIYYTYNLSLIESDDLQASIVADTEYSDDGSYFRFGNQVNLNENRENYVGSANLVNISFNIPKINSYCQQNGLNYEKYVFFVALHEIGHNLGLLDNDPIDVMSGDPQRFNQSNSLGIESSSYVVYPCYSKDFTKLLIERINKRPESYIGNIWHR